MTHQPWDEQKKALAIQLVEELVPGIKRTGLKVVELAPRRARLRVPLAGNENHIGIMYAGALFAAGETPGGALFLSTFDSSKYVPVVKRVDIRFKRPAVTDVTIDIELGQEEVDRVERELEARDRSDFVLEGEIRDAEGRVVAETTATYQIRTMT